MTTLVAGTLDEAMTPVWLSAALSKNFPDTVVSAVEVRDVLHGVGTKALLTLTYEGTTTLPNRLCLKAGYEPHNKHILDGGTYMREALFYQHIASDLPVNTPHCFYADYDESSKQGILLMEDLHASGTQFGSALRGYTVDEAVRFVDALAAMHAKYWGGKVLEVYPWLRGPVPVSSDSSMYTERLGANLKDGRANNVPMEIRDADRILAAAGRLQGLVDQQHTCLAHGDSHAGNLFMTASGEPGWYDWQTVQASTWAIDVPYFISAALSHEDRRASRDDLLRHYLDRLSAYGATPPTWDEAWLAYRQFLAYGLFMWAITRPIVQPVPVINAFVDRLGNAAAEAGTFEALGV
jgi:hypothetical protein